MPATRTIRTTVFAPRIAELLDTHRGTEVFRLDHDTVGVAEPEIMNRLLAARPMNEFERPTFKPFLGRSIGRNEAAAVMQAVSQDVRRALRRTPPEAVDLSGVWPRTGHVFLRDLIFPADPFRMRLLLNRKLEAAHALAWTAAGAAALLPGKPGPDAPVSTLAAHAFAGAAHGSYRERLHAMGMYRRMAAPVCFTVATLVASSIWLGAPFPADVPNAHILAETLRLIPPSWNLLRRASPEYPALDERIGPGDDVLLLPLLTQRDPAYWDDPDDYRPERWAGLDPDHQPGYLPFGHASERCWGRHLVLPLAELLLDLLRAGNCTVSPEQTVGRIPLDGLLGVAGVRVVRR